MQIKVTKEKAIKVLNKRITEIDAYSFEPNSWKNKTKNDVMEIFGDLTKSLQISFINFNTPVTESKSEVLEKGKKEAKELIKSYIENIEEYILEPNKNIDPKVLLNIKIKNLEQESNSHILKNNALETELLSNESEISNYKNKIQSLEKNTVQLNDISLSKLLTLISNLPVRQLIRLISIIIGVIGFSFFIGKVYKETSFRNSEYNLNRKYEKALNEKMILIDSLKSLKSNVISDYSPKNTKIDIVIFNSNSKAVSVEFENISKNNNKIKSTGVSIHPRSFGKISLEKSNYRLFVKKFIDYKKDATTEKKNIIDSIIRINEKDDIKVINIK
mgnify:CR=1 FL=1|jgi:hypothetical protein|tara:strand:+ start:248 stop:1240 length:993 start_codon:yes stop_codon:yes gene_type:complete